MYRTTARRDSNLFQRGGIYVKKHDENSWFNGEGETGCDVDCDAEEIIIESCSEDDDDGDNEEINDWDWSELYWEGESANRDVVADI